MQPDLKRILLVEDAHEVLDLLRQAAATFNLPWEVEAVSGSQARHKRWRDYDLVILDIMMPDINGDRLAIEQGGQGPPLLLFSALNGSRLQAIAQEILKATGRSQIRWVNKGSDLRSLIQVIESLLAPSS